MKTSRINEEYKNGVDHFLEFVQQNAKEMGGKYLCPCVKCGNERQHVVNGIKNTYCLQWDYSELCKMHMAWSIAKHPKRVPN